MVPGGQEAAAAIPPGGCDIAAELGGWAAVYMRVSKGEPHTENQRPDITSANVRS